MRQFCVRYGMPALLALSLAAAGGGLACAMFYQPGRVEVDCRGYQIDVEVMKDWEKREKEGSAGLTDMAGWRVEDRDEVTGVSTGRKALGKVIGVYGSMDMVFPAKILSGNYGLSVEDGYCVMSESLAHELFGAVDVAGEQVRYGERLLSVAGVIDKKEDYLLIPITEGEVEYLELRFQNGWKTDEKVNELLERR